LVATDENHAYNSCGARRGPHQFNRILLVVAQARGIIVTYHNVGKEYLPLYLNEFSFRFNNRKNPDMFAAILRRVASAGSGRKAVDALKYRGSPQGQKAAPDQRSNAPGRRATKGRTPKGRP